MNRDWSQLPPELLELIAENVVSISDFIRFRSVCTSWRKAGIPSKLRPQPPVVVLPYNIFNPDRYFFSIATGKAHHISLPQLVGKEILFTANGWMLLKDVKTEKLTLHNPVSLASIHLSSPKDSSQKIDCGRLFYDQFTDSYVVLVYDAEIDEACSWFCKVGDESWSVLNINFDSFFDRILYHNGKFFQCVRNLIYIDDVSVSSSAQFSSTTSIEDIPESSAKLYGHFLTAADGELFLVFEFADSGFSLYKLDFDGPWFKWTKVQFEDYAIFISVPQPIMFCVRDFPQYQKSCAYSPQWAVWEYFGHKSREGVCKIDCKDGDCEFMACDWERPADFNQDLLWISLSLG